MLDAQDTYVSFAPIVFTTIAFSRDAIMANSMKDIKIEKVVINCCVGESGK